MAQAAALSTHAACGQPQGAFGPAGRGCCLTALQKASPAAAPAAGGPEPPLPACCAAISATRCTAVLRVTNRPTSGCGQTRRGGTTTATHQR